MNVTAPTTNRILFKGYTPIWTKSLNRADIDLFCSIPLKNDLFGRLDLDVENVNSSANEFKILLLNSLKKVLGYEEVQILPDRKIMMGRMIEVEPEYRKSEKKRGHKFGELLRLSSIMTMMKNNLDSINIFSKGSAVYFHNKYKFEPNMSDYFERNSVLKSIINDKSNGFTDLSERAAKIYAQAVLVGNGIAGQKLTRETNGLVKEYIQRAIKDKNPNGKHKFASGMDMILTKETILNNRAYFNSLFKKHGIDFEI